MDPKKQWQLRILLPISFLVILGLIISFAYQPVINAQDYDLEKDLPVVGSLDNLHDLLKHSESSIYLTRNDMIIGRDFVENKVSLNAAQKTAPTEETGYSSTNVQVDGVDEADIIKTDGKYIYQVQGQRLTIVKAHPAIDMEIVNSFTFVDPGFQANDLYVDGNYLVCYEL